jgi:hypothetical protein
MGREAKDSRATVSSKPVIETAGWLEAPWHYVTIGYCGQQLGLLVETDDEEEAWREAEELCNGFDAQAKVLWVRKVAIQ